MEETLDNNILDNIINQIGTIRDSLTLFKMQISTLQQQLNGLEKGVKKQFKMIKKDKKNKKEKVKRAPSGFAKPTKVTKELCSFMNQPEGTEIARTEVTRTLINYIQKNNLIKHNEETNTKQIIPDKKLKDLLGLENKDENELTYFNIQKYMNKHFCKNVSNSESA